MPRLPAVGVLMFDVASSDTLLRVIIVLAIQEINFNTVSAVRRKYTFLDQPSTGSSWSAICCWAVFRCHFSIITVSVFTLKTCRGDWCTVECGKLIKRSRPCVSVLWTFKSSYLYENISFKLKKDRSVQNTSVRCLIVYCLFIDNCLLKQHNGNKTS